MDILKQVHEPAKKRTHSPPKSEDISSPKKKMKNLAGFLADISPTQDNLSPADSITSPGSSEKRTDESSESPSTRRKKIGRRRASGGALGHANAMLELQRTIQRNYKMLIAKMEPTEIAGKFNEKGIFDTKAMDCLQKGHNRRMKNEILIKEVCRVRQGNRENIGFDMFISILRETGQGRIATELEDSQSQTPIPDNQPHERNNLQNFVKEMEETLLEEVEPKIFINEIISMCGLPMKDFEDINMKKNRRQRMQSLLELIKSAKSSIALKIINILLDAYPDLYEAFKNGKKGSRSKPQTSAANDCHLVSVGVPLHMTLNIFAGNTSAVQDTSEHTDPHTVMRKRKENFKEIESQIVNNIDENQDQLGAILENCIAGLEDVKFSSINVFLKSLSKETLQRLLLFSSSKAMKTLVLSLINEETKKKLVQMNAKCVLEIFKGYNDKADRETFVKECFCHFNKESVTRNFTILMEGTRGSKCVIKRLLNYHIIEDRTKFYLKKIDGIDDNSERNATLLKFYLQNDLPDVCFCILEEEIVKHDGSNIIRAMIKAPEVSNSAEMRPVKLTREDIRKCKELLNEELEVRWFIRRLEIKKDPQTEALLDVILSSESRNERNGPFLEYLLKQDEFTWFLEELETRNEPLYEALVSRISSNTTSDLKALDFKKMQMALQYFFDEIIEEVDPLLLSKLLQRNSQQELNISKFESIPERAKRATGFFLKLLDVSESTFADTMHAMKSCGYKDIVDSIKALVREGPLDDRYRCPNVLCLEECRETIVYKETFTFDDRSKTETNTPSGSTERNIEEEKCSEIEAIEISSDSDDDILGDDEIIVLKPQTRNSKGDKTSTLSSILQGTRNRFAHSFKGYDADILPGSGSWYKGFNTDDDSDSEYSRTDAGRRKTSKKLNKGKTILPATSERFTTLYDINGGIRKRHSSLKLDQTKDSIAAAFVQKPLEYCKKIRHETKKTNAS